MVPHDASFWNRSGAELLQQLESSLNGLTPDEARRRHDECASDPLKPRRRSSDLVLFLSQFGSPLILILLVAAGLAFFSADRTDTAIILTIVLLSGVLGVWQERGATRAVERLLAVVRVTADALRDGTPEEVAADELVPGDVVLLRAGDTIPGDCVVLESKELFVDEAALTGETYPVENVPAVLPTDTPLRERANSLFLGAHVVIGTGLAVVILRGGWLSDGETGGVRERSTVMPAREACDRAR